ncbi:hypothetical protein SDC9_207690 [bioreactor metagenome]|uniref:Uncharacterized protein n=1 Tax=bioreactor metagenome TaxID=1076179 RepID=A0A645J9A0_9ZZZZ
MVETVHIVPAGNRVHKRVIVFLELVIRRLRAARRKMVGYSADVAVYGHAVVVKQNYQRLL